MRCTRIKQHSCKYSINRKHTQHDVWRFLSFFSMHEKKTAVAVERIPWGKPSSGLNTMLLLSWGICIGGCNILLVGALVGAVTLISTVITSHLRLVLCCDRHSIASSPRGSVGVGGSIVVVELRWCTVKIARVVKVVVISSGPWVSTVGIGRTVHRESFG